MARTGRFLGLIFFSQSFGEMTGVGNQEAPQFVAASAPVCEDRGEILAPELQESCGDSSTVHPTELSSVEDLAMPSTPYVGSGGVMAPNSEALFAKEIGGLLACLEVISPGYGKAIASVLAGNALEDLIRKVDKSVRTVTIRGKRRKRGIARKPSIDAWP